MIPDALTMARAIHVLALVHWIGGVAAVTTIVLPLARRLGDAEAAVEFFESFERRFVRQLLAHRPAMLQDFAADRLDGGVGEIGLAEGAHGFNHKVIR